MFILDTTLKSLQILLGGAVTTNQLVYEANYADLTATGTTLIANDGLTNSTTAVTPVAAPAASTVRKLMSLNVYNADTAAAIVTVRLNNNGTFRNLAVVTLGIGYSLTVTNEGWKVTDNLGEVLYSVSVGAPSGAAGGDLTGTYPNPTIAAGAVTEAKQTLADNTTNDVSTTKHGYAPKAVAPASGLQNVFGIANGETAVTNKPLFDTTNPAALGTAAPGTQVIAARQDHVHLKPSMAFLAVVVALTDGATPALDASLGDMFTLAAAGNRTIAVPSNPTNGQKIIIRHLASGGARTLALNSGAGGFRFGTDITALTQTASGKTDYIGCIYSSIDSFWDVVAYTKGF